MRPSGFPLEVKLKDGRTAVIRLLEFENAQGLLDFYRALPPEDRLFLKDDVTTQPWLERYMQKVDFETFIPLIAEVDGKIVGSGDLERPRFGWKKHVGHLRVVVAHQYQRSGIGTALLGALVKVAVNIGVEKLAAEAFENQAGARRAFKKAGFTEETILRNHVQDIHGRRRDLVIMTNDVTRIWDVMGTMMLDRPQM